MFGRRDVVGLGDCYNELRRIPLLRTRVNKGYSHFPDELSLGKACSSLELSDNPLPDSGPWQEIADFERRLRVALAKLYSYFRRRERLWTNILRDQEMPLTNDDPKAREADAEIMEPISLHWERMKQSLATDWGVADESHHLLLSAIGLALDFQTWRAMARRQDLSDEQAIELMVGMVRCVAGVARPG
jgi:hypothetical protein